MTFYVPPTLARAVDAEPSRSRLEWLAELPRTVAALTDVWGLIVGPPFDPGGQTAWVAPATDASGRDLVLKVGWAHFEAEQEAEGLQVWRGRGTVLMHNSSRAGDTTALLLERCRPGTPLSALSEPEQDRVVGDLLLRLWQAPTVAVEFRPLLTMCEAWAAGFHERRAAMPADAPALDAGLTQAGIELFVALATPTKDDVVLCTDLHAGNILAAQRQPWLVIDPKPFLGDRCYDVLQHMLNCQERLTADPAGLAQRMADLLALDRDRVRHWLFARCVIESIGDPALRTVATTLAPG